MTGLMVWIDDKPIKEKLLGDIEELGARLAELESKVSVYFKKDLPQYQSWVGHRFSSKLKELNDLEKKLQVMGRHIQETVELSMDIGLSPKEILSGSDKAEFFDFEAGPELAQEAPPSNEINQASRKIKKSTEVKDLFRKIARCLHPDRCQGPLSERKKELWVRVQQAYANNDFLELRSLDKLLRCGGTAPSLSCSGLIDQLSEFKLKCEKLINELAVLKNEKAWKFSKKENLKSLEKELEMEFKMSMRQLKSRENAFERTLNSWFESKISSKETKLSTKPRRQAPKSQVSLFDA